MVAIIAGTNRKDSYSIKTANYYSSIFNAKNVDNWVIDLGKLPQDFVFSALYHNRGKNELFNEFEREIKIADRYVFVIPEYNGSFPGVLKAFIDGLDYPSPFKGKKAALIGISAGNQGSALAMSHFTDILNYLECDVLSIKPRCPFISKAINENGFKDKLITSLIDTQTGLLLQ